jgi:hypothetical protein
MGYRPSPCDSSLVERIEVRGEPLPGQPRPGARLVVRGNLVGAIRLANGNVKRDNSPGECLSLWVHPGELFAELELWRHKEASSKENRRR